MALRSFEKKPFQEEAGNFQLLGIVKSVMISL